MYYIYILKCEHGELYTGITSDLSRRMKEHFFRTEKCARFTKSHKATALEAVWTTETRSAASKLEWQIKQLKRAEKLLIINLDEYFADIIGEEQSKNFQRFFDFSIDDLLK